MNSLSFLYRYPVYVMGRHPRNKTVRGAVLVRQTQVEVLPVSAHDAPVAATITQEQTMFGRRTIASMSFRHHDGAFYTPSRFRQCDLEMLFANPFESVAVGKSIVSEVRRLARGSDCWPKGIIEQFDNPFMPLTVGNLCIKDSNLIELAPNQEEILLFQDERAETMSRHFIIVDGQLWERSPEPSYKLISGKKELTIVTDEIDGPVPMRAEKYPGDARFSLLDRGLALEIFRKFYGGSGDGLPDVEISIPEAFTTDYAPANLVCLARCLTESNYGGRNGPMADRVGALRNQVKDIPLPEIDVELVETLVAELVASNERFGIFGAVCNQAIQQHMDLWESRPVDLNRLDGPTPRP
ncbi:hypothetical protein GOB57_21725 [Sinorhizobium meliloti]|nr:hypothetical protein [Sinorhizobium meliloti]